MARRLWLPVTVPRMRGTLAVLILIGLSVSIAEAEEKATPLASKLSTLTPEDDWRLAKQAGAQTQKIGVLSYYPNNGGGYTFLERAHIEFYSLPYAPTRYWTHNVEFEVVNVHGKAQALGKRSITGLNAIGTSKMPFGGQTFYRSEMKDMNTGVVFRREDVPIARLTRDDPGSKFQLSIWDDDHETQLKLKSIKPMLEQALRP
jgi:hypothetical protein